MRTKKIMLVSIILVASIMASSCAFYYDESKKMEEEQSKIEEEYSEQLKEYWEQYFEQMSENETEEDEELEKPDLPKSLRDYKCYFGFDGNLDGKNIYGDFVALASLAGNKIGAQPDQTINKHITYGYHNNKKYQYYQSDGLNIFSGKDSGDGLALGNIIRDDTFTISVDIGIDSIGYVGVGQPLFFFDSADENKWLSVVMDYDGKNKAPYVPSILTYKNNDLRATQNSIGKMYSGSNGASNYYTITYVQNGKECNLYENGEWITGGTLGADLIDGVLTEDMELYLCINHDVGMLQIEMENLYIYDRALSENEIDELYQYNKKTSFYSFK
ncbi:MAG: hypothetical protein IJV71_01630 [Lachnospiraceae bacterium]|nr:hypothetical protein [Lachnospiraceae bacterium]